MKSKIEGILLMGINGNESEEVMFSVEANSQPQNGNKSKSSNSRK